jgi:hypothetical protein
LDADGLEEPANALGVANERLDPECRREAVLLMRRAHGRVWGEGAV